jgi:4-amino-4-deoxy-L-arabinose transferase-like glycosyltransferase
MARLLLPALLLLYTGLALAFSLTGPIFEGPDELAHFRYMQTLVATGALPDPAQPPRGQSHQPPLYYLLHAPLLALLNDPAQDDFAERKNPFYGFRFDLPGGDNKNEYVHRRAELFPALSQPIARTVHTLRLLNIALGAATLLACWWIARRLWPADARRWLATGFVAAMPQFVYLSGQLNNDNLLTLLATLMLAWLLHHHGRAVSLRQAALFGGLCGAAVLTKSSAIFLALPVGVALLLNPGWWRRLPVIVLAALAVAGGYYARNGLLYGDLTLLSAWQTTWSFDVVSGGGFVLPVALHNLPYVYLTFWGRFGSGAITLGDFYSVFHLVTLAALAGLVWQGVRARRRGRPAGPWWIVLAFAAAWLLAAVYLAGIAWSGNQGRYLLPGIAAWALLVAAGLTAPLPRRWLPGAVCAACGAWAGVALVAFGGFFLPAYQVQPVPERLPHPLSLRHGDVAELIGTSAVSLTAAPGDTAQLTLYWRALAPSPVDLHVYLHSQDSPLIRRDSLPATGKRPAGDWLPGETWAESYWLPIPADAERQRVYPLVAGLYAAPAGPRLAVTSAGGQTVTPQIGRLVIPGAPEAAPPLAYRFGDEIGLAAPALTVTGDALRLCLTWLALRPMATGYTLFVHGLSAEDVIVRQVDVAPREHYPTDAWPAGEVVRGCVRLEQGAVPIVRLAVGLYRPADFARLPITAAAGTPLGDRLLLDF